MDCDFGVKSKKCLPTTMSLTFFYFFLKVLYFYDLCLSPLYILNFFVCVRNKI